MVMEPPYSFIEISPLKFYIPMQKEKVILFISSQGYLIIFKSIITTENISSINRNYALFLALTIKKFGRFSSFLYFSGACSLNKRVGFGSITFSMAKNERVSFKMV